MGGVGPTFILVSFFFAGGSGPEAQYLDYSVVEDYIQELTKWMMLLVIVNMIQSSNKCHYEPSHILGPLTILSKVVGQMPYLLLRPCML